MHTPLRLLLLGKRPDVMQRLLAEIQAAGFQAEGSTDITAAPHQFDARRLDLIGLGGGVSPHERQVLQTAFAAQNPAIALLDLVAPVAVAQVQSFAAGRLGQVLGPLTASLHGETLEISWHRNTPGPLALRLYHYDGGPHAVPLFAGPAPAGETRLNVPATQLGQGPNFLVAEADGDLATCRL